MIFLIGGLIVSMVHGGKCLTPPCSSGSGFCPETLGGCFTVYNNPLMLVLDFPSRIVFQSTPIMNDFYNLTISPIFWVFGNQIYEYVLTNMILYFAAGAIIGLAVMLFSRKRKNHKAKYPD